MGKITRGGYAFSVAAGVGLAALVLAILSYSPRPPETARTVVAEPRQGGPTAEPSPTTPERVRTPRQRVEDRRSYVVVVGDAFSTGSTLEGAPTWVTLLGRRYQWEVRTIATDDAGFRVGGADSLTALATDGRLARYPADLVIVAAGAEDLAEGRAGLVTDAARLLRRVRAQLPYTDLVLLSPFSPGAPTARTAELSAALSRLAPRKGAGYLDVSQVLAGPLARQIEDGVPTRAGQRRIADSVGDFLTRTGRPRYDAWRDPAATATP